MENEFGYFSKDVAHELEITTSTLRRWSILLEKGVLPTFRAKHTLSKIRQVNYSFLYAKTLNVFTNLIF